MASDGEQLPEGETEAAVVDPADAPGGSEEAGLGGEKDGGGEGGEAAVGNGGGAGAGEGSADTVPSALTDALVKAIAYLATGAGFLTFVGATGAAVTWVRLNAAELPATEALQLVGVRHLVADGAVTLIAFAVLGLLAVTFIYVVDVPSRDTDEMRHGLTLLAMSESLIAIWMANTYLELEHQGWAIAGVVALAILTIAISLLPQPQKADIGTRAAEARRRHRLHWLRRLDRLRAALWTDRPPRLHLLCRLRRLRRRFGRRIASFDRSPPTNQQLGAEIERRALRRRLGLRPEPLPEKWKKRVRPVPMLVLATAAFLVGLVYVREYHDWVGWSIWLAWGLAGLCFGVARTTERFWLYGTAVFLSVTLFGAWLNVVRLTDSPQLSPVALLRTGNEGTSGVVGLHIARTDDRYWLGAVTMACQGTGEELRPDHVKEASGRIFSIPRSQIVDDTLGARTGTMAVGDEALEMLRELVQRQPPGGAPPPGTPATAAEATETTDATGSATETTDATGSATETTGSAGTVTSASTATAAGAGPSDAAAAQETPDDSTAAVPPTLAVTGRCMHQLPHLARLNPATAAPGDEVEVIGSDLGVKPGRDDAVTVNGTRAQTTPGSWQNQSIVFTVPKLRPQRVSVQVLARDRTSNVLALQIAPNGPPIAAFSSRLDRGSAVSFRLDARRSRDPEDKLLRYHWSSGGRTLGRKRTQSITVPRDRKCVDVTLTVTDDRGQRATAQRTPCRGIERETLLNDATFPTGKSALTKAGRLQIKELRAELQSTAAKIARIDISGYADFVGTSSFNQDLSLRRAQAVRKELLKSLKPRPRDVRVRGYGESRARARTWNDPRRGRDRRVDVSVTLLR